MLLIGPIAACRAWPWLFCVVSGGRPHGTTQEAGYDVGQSGGRPHGTICHHNIIFIKTQMWSNVVFVAFFFLLSVWSF